LNFIYFVLVLLFAVVNQSKIWFRAKQYQILNLLWGT